MTKHSILVYAGRGASHSWTWLADLFERHGIYNAQFVGAAAFSERLSDGAGTAIISGGDGHRVASALGPHGFSHLKGFIHNGGEYVGICAGAYLPLASSVEPFSSFNISSTKIENIETSQSFGEEPSPRLAVRYGSCSIIHPVRGDLELEMCNSAFRAPLYGGPVFREPLDDEVLVRYRTITSGTELQIDRARAISMITGKPAVIKSRHGRGDLLLFGPHLEHPRYPEANALFLKMTGLEGEPESETARQSSEVKANRYMERALADLRVAVLGLENRSFLIGNKLWDGSRFLELVNAVEGRCHTVDESLAEELTGSLMRVRAEILKAKPESLLYADDGPERLVEAARLVVDNHFQVLRESRNRWFYSSPA